jgi:hypothetical protein
MPGIRGRLHRNTHLAGKITVTYREGKIIPVAGSIISEFTHPPFALVMSDKTGFKGAADITRFANWSYNQQVKDLTLKLLVIKGESPLPGSFG